MAVEFEPSRDTNPYSKIRRATNDLIGDDPRHTSAENQVGQTVAKKIEREKRHREPSDVH
jgi:hypothetical protein